MNKRSKRNAYINDRGLSVSCKIYISLLAHVRILHMSYILESALYLPNMVLGARRETSHVDIMRKKGSGEGKEATAHTAPSKVFFGPETHDGY